MALFEWNDRFNVKIESIDEQHKKLVGLINSLHDARLKGDADSVLDKILSELVSYTDYHFKHEEKLFDQYNYAGTSEHKKEHADLLNQVGDFYSQFKSGKAVVNTEIMNFLKDWLKNHILVSDMAYTAFLVEKGAK